MPGQLCAETKASSEKSSRQQLSSVQKAHLIGNPCWPELKPMAWKRKIKALM